MLIVADNLQIMNQAVARALVVRDPAPLGDLARRCEERGAQALDLNPGPTPKTGGERMSFLVEAVQAATRLPLVLDTADPAVMAAGLEAARNPVLINGFSLEPAKLSAFLPLALRFDAYIVGYLLRPDGRVPEAADDRLSLAVSLFEAAGRVGLGPERLIVDPVLLPIQWADGPRRAREVLETLRLLPELLGFPVRTVAGLSNLTSGPGPLEKKLRIEQAYLPMLAAAGLDMVLMNVLRPGAIETARAAEALLGAGVFAWDAV